MTTGATKVHEHRFFETEEAKRLWDERLDLGWPTHIRPFSTLIACMGNHWYEGCKEAVMEMGKFAWEQGYEVAVYEEADRCYNPYDGLGLMRNLAYQKAIREGFEFLCYVDNDVKPRNDALVRLVHRFVPVISPILIYWDGQDHGLKLPKIERGRGLAMVTCIPLSMLVFQTAVFLPWAITPFWQSEIGADEAYHFARLAMAGHRPFVDTDVVVEVMSAPHYPLEDRWNRSVDELKGWSKSRSRDAIAHPEKPPPAKIFRGGRL